VHSRPFLIAALSSSTVARSVSGPCRKRLQGRAGEGAAMVGEWMKWRPAGGCQPAHWIRTVQCSAVQCRVHTAQP
jgi:hypothetical protein